MVITVRLLGSYRRFLPDQHDQRAGYAREVRDDCAIADLLAELCLPPSGPSTFLVNGQHASADQVLQDGDVVAVFPAAGGG